MTDDIEQLISETVELTGTEPPELLADDSPALVDRAGDDESFYLIGVIGGKDVGKSSLINALVGREITARTSYGPGTESVIAYAHQSVQSPLRVLLEREVPGRYQIRPHDIAHLSRQVLLDLPDIDSVYSDHIETTRRMLRHMLYPLWVQSIEKYADQRPQKLLSRVAEGNDPANFIFCLNKCDQLLDREGPAAIEQLRDDYSQRVARLLKLESPPRVFMISALRPDELDLPALRELLSRQRSTQVVHTSRELADRQRLRTILGWFDELALDERAARAKRLLDEAQELTAARIATPLLETAIPWVMDDPAYRMSMVEPAVAARMARWPIVGIVHSVLSPVMSLVRRNLASSPSLGGGEFGNVDAQHVSSLIQTTFAQLQQTSPVISVLYRDQKLWEEVPALAAVSDLRARFDATLQRQRSELMTRIAGRRGIIAPVIRSLLTIGALLWFPIIQPVLEIAAARDFKWATIDAVRLAISLLSSVYLLRSAGFLLLYFLALWAIVRWDTHRRAARLIERWRSAGGVDASRAALSLPDQVIDWLDDLLDPIRRHVERVEALMPRVEALRTSLDAQRRAA